MLLISHELKFLQATTAGQHPAPSSTTHPHHTHAVRRLLIGGGSFDVMIQFLARARAVPGAWLIAAATRTITCASAPAMPDQARSMVRLISLRHITGNGGGMRCSSICSRFPQTMQRRCGVSSHICVRDYSNGRPLLPSGALSHCSRCRRTRVFVVDRMPMLRVHYCLDVSNASL